MICSFCWLQGIQELIKTLQGRGVAVFLISGGFRWGLAGSHCFMLFLMARYDLRLLLLAVHAKPLCFALSCFSVQYSHA